MPSSSRISITKEQRIALRQKHQSEPDWKQQKLCDWFNSQYRSGSKQIVRSQVSECLSTKYKHLDLNPASKSSTAIRDKSAKYPELEKALFEWQQRIFTRKVAVTGEILIESAKRLWTSMPCYQNTPPPNFSVGWLHNFKKRWRIKKQAIVGEAGDADAASAETRMEELRPILAEYSSQDIYNMDETALFWKLTPSTTLATESMPGRKHDKARISIFITTNADGSHKVKPWVIGRAAKPRAFALANIKTNAALPVEWRYNANAWCTTDLMLDFLVWFDDLVAPRQVLLLMDRFSAHEAAVRFLQEEAPEERKTQPLRHVRIEFLPPNVTSLYQPCDQGIIRTWKHHWRRRWLSYQVDEADADRDPQRTMNVLKAIRWVAQAWEEVDAVAICNCWRKSTLLGPTLTAPSYEEAAKIVAMEQKQQIDRERMAEQVRHLVPRRDYRMDLDFFLSGQAEEEVDDSPDEYLNHVAEVYGSVTERVAESEEEAEVEERISPRTAIEAIKTLQIYEQQQEQPQEQLAGLLRRRQREIEESATRWKHQQRLTDFFH